MNFGLEEQEQSRYDGQASNDDGAQVPQAVTPADRDALQHTSSP